MLLGGYRRLERQKMPNKAQSKSEPRRSSSIFAPSPPFAEQMPREKLKPQAVPQTSDAIIKRPLSRA